MPLLSVTEYSANPDTNLLKYVQINLSKTKFFKKLPIVCWIFYSDEASLPIINPLCKDVKNILVGDTPVELGWVCADDLSFHDLNVSYRSFISDEELSAYIRVTRNKLLLNCDWLVSRHTSQINKTLSDAEFLELQTYMQELRDFPASVDLNNITWPTKPAFMN